MKRMRLVAAVFFCAVLAGCSSDAPNEPEPALDNAGAFAATEAAGGELSLLRTLVVAHIHSETIVFFTVYDVTPSSWDDAREIAKREELPIRQPLFFDSRDRFTANPYRVVWFRTLTKEERDRAP
jgi:hypothetical protein